MQGYEALHPTVQRVFAKTHVKHLQAMGANERANYELDQVKEIKHNVKEQCLEVYYKNGEWFKYYANGTWGELVNVCEFKRIGYVSVSVNGRTLNRSQSIRVIRAFKYRLFRIGNSIKINSLDKWEYYLYFDLFNIAGLEEKL